MPHSENCELCSTSTFQKESHLSNLRLKNCDKVMLSASFQKCEDNNSPYKRVYFTSQLANYYVIYTITVDSSLVRHCAVFNRIIDKTWTFLQSLPPTSDKNINYFETFWKNINIYEGNNDVQDVIKKRLDFKVPFPSQAGNESLAYLENETMVKLL